MRPARALAVSAAVLALVFVASGCGGAAVDKQGAPARATTVLRIGTADPADPELAHFAAALERRSGNRLRAEIDATTYFSETPGGEGKLAGDLRAGRVPFGWVPSRDWAATDDPGFLAMQAPFLLSSTASATALAASPVAAELLSGVRGYGAIGLALVPGEARRLASRRPVLSVRDLTGARVRINDSAQTARLVSALGATAVQGRTAVQTHTALRDGGLDAVETSPTYVRENSYNSVAPYLSSFGLLPKLTLLAANPGAWARLDSRDQGAVRAAAYDTVTHAVVDVPAQETHALSLLCANGAVVVEPADKNLAALAALAAPARRAEDAGAGAPGVQAQIDRIAAAVTGTGPQAFAAPVPTDCAVARTTAQARSMHATATAGDVAGPAEGAFPVGTFRFTVTAEQWRDAGLMGSDWQHDITFTFAFRPDGTLHATQDPDFADQGPGTGTWSVRGDLAELRSTQSSDPSTVYDETVRWSYFRGELHFTIVSVQDDASRVMYGRPWRKVG